MGPVFGFVKSAVYPLRPSLGTLHALLSLPCLPASLPWGWQLLPAVLTLWGGWGREAVMGDSHPSLTVPCPPAPLPFISPLFPPEFEPAFGWACSRLSPECVHVPLDLSPPHHLTLSSAPGKRWPSGCSQEPGSRQAPRLPVILQGPARALPVCCRLESTAPPAQVSSPGTSCYCGSPWFNLLAPLQIPGNCTLCHWSSYGLFWSCQHWGCSLSYRIGGGWILDGGLGFGHSWG